MRGRRFVLAQSVLFLAANGCASIDPEADYARAARLASEAVGEPLLYRPGDDDASAGTSVEALLEGGLSLEDAVRLSLLNNPELQGSFAEIGVARADLVEAGLLSNPSLSALVRIPTTGGASIIEAGITQNLIELWHIPLRKEIGEHRLRRAILDISHRAADLASAARFAYFGAVAAERQLEIETENLATMRELVDLVQARMQAGAATQVDVNVARSELLEQQVVARVARLQAYMARNRLAVLLGLSANPESLVLSDSLPDVDPQALDQEAQVVLALAHRLDVQAAREAIEAARVGVKLERRRFLEKVAPGAGLETENGDLTVGPAGELEIPLFNRNQAGVARARFRLQALEKSLESLVLAVTQDTRLAVRSLTVAAEVVQFYAAELLPLQEENLELARESFRLGRTGFLSVLESQRVYLSTRRRYVGELEALARSIVDIQRVVARPLHEILGRGDAGSAENERAGGDASEKPSALPRADDETTETTE